MIFFIRNPNLTKKSGGCEGRGGGVARVSIFFFLFLKKSEYDKKLFPFERVTVREDWLT